jgi:hypothetical protein
MVRKFKTEVIDEFERRFGRDAAWRRACDLMIAYFSQLQPKMPFPELATRGLEVAVRYQRGEVDIERLMEARLAAWQYLKDQKAIAVQRTPEQRIVHALSLLLYKGPGPGEPFDDSGDVIFSLWDVAHGFDSNPDGIATLVNQYFSSAPNGHIGP